MHLLDINYAELFRNIPSPIATMLISMLPVAELRAAIPVALNAFGMHPASAYLWAVIGSIIPPVLFVFFLDAVSRFLSRHSKWFASFFSWLFEKTQRKTKAKIEKYGAFGVLLVAAMPIPILGGGWTAALGAFIFGIQKRKSIPAIVAGTMIMGVIILGMTLGVQRF